MKASTIKRQVAQFERQDNGRKLELLAMAFRRAWLVESAEADAYEADGDTEAAEASRSFSEYYCGKAKGLALAAAVVNKEAFFDVWERVRDEGAYMSAADALQARRARELLTCKTSTR